MQGSQNLAPWLQNMGYSALLNEWCCDQRSTDSSSSFDQGIKFATLLNLRAHSSKYCLYKNPSNAELVLERGLAAIHKLTWEYLRQADNFVESSHKDNCYMPVPALLKNDTFWHLCPDEEDEEEEDEEDENEVEVEETDKRDQGNVKSDNIEDNISPDMVVPATDLEEIGSTEVATSFSAFLDVLVPECQH
ncbi:hypothetical protein BKA93DRAFT_748808 [Sparassis latifolia]